jgi:hypothetical protein
MSSPVYPSSLDVTAGQPTGYQQYNRLRSDALRLGASQNDAVPLGRFLAQYVSGIRLTYLATHRLRITYDPRYPPSIMINGYMCQVTENVDLPSGSISGSAATWYLFVNRSAGSSGFTLSANTSSAEAADQRLIGACYWTGTVIDETSIQTYLTDSSGSKMQIVTLHAYLANTTATSYATGVVCHQILDFGKIKPGARSAYLIANLFTTTASGFARFYNTTSSVTIVEISTTSTAATNMVKSGDILASLPAGEVETRFEIKTSGTRSDCYWAALVLEYA